jgi:hypothetical protein
MRHALVVSLLLIPTPLPACQCLLTLSACHEVAVADRVFIGTVESVAPGFLSRWNPEKSSSLLLSQELAGLQKDQSPSSLASLKDEYQKVFPDLPEYYKNRLAAAKTSDDISKLFYSIMAQGRRIRFKVRTTFRGEKEKEDSDDEEGTLEVWTDGGDCGYDFQEGETYLVYADEDEETDSINTSVCYRNRRLSDAGDDLAYLFFFQNGGDESARLEGFVTANEFYQRDLDKAHDPEKVKLPAPGVILELNSGQGRRYTESDRDGRFVFDGLAGGEYSVSVFDAGYPEPVKLLAGPARIEVEKKGCATQILLVPKRVSGQ